MDRTELGVEIRERLVQKKRLRLAHQRPAKSHTLTLAAGELRGPPRKQRPDAEHLADVPDAPFDLRPRDMAKLQPKAKIVAHGHVRIEGVVLEDDGDVAVGGIDVVDTLPANKDVAGGHGLEPGDHAKGRRLSAARGAQKDHELAVGD